MNIVFKFACVGLLVIAGMSASAQDMNFPDRKALIVNTCPFVELSDFVFDNTYSDRSTRFYERLSWTNKGTQPIVAFEVVVLKYDAFDQRMIGSRWTVTGTDSANWSPLPPGGSSRDATSSYGAEEVFTAIAYVRNARLADGTVWRVNDAELLQELRKVAPSLKEIGSTAPDPKPKATQGQ